MAMDMLTRLYVVFAGLSCVLDPIIYAFWYRPVRSLMVQVSCSTFLILFYIFQGNFFILETSTKNTNIRGKCVRRVGEELD